MEVLALDRTLTELDHARLQGLARRDRPAPGTAAACTLIGPLLDDCAVVPSRLIPPDVVTMYSQVLLRDLQTGQPSKLTLCYPADAEPAAGFVSVLSPVGAALLGQTVGSVARWAASGGVAGAAEITAVLFQPEASGDYTL